MNAVMNQESTFPLDQVIHGDALEVLKTLPDNSVDSLILDPPAGINFMGRDFDDDRGGRDQWIAWLAAIMREALRVTKPGGHAFVWALPRTAHWTAMALEDAGWEIRSKTYHLFSSGFPKSYDIAKGVEGLITKGSASWNTWQTLPGERIEGANQANGMVATNEVVGNRPRAYVSTGSFELAATTPEAEQWQGWGTATAPAAEEWILCRKPLSEPNIARNVLKWGVGGLNIDKCRIGSELGLQRPARQGKGVSGGWADYKQDPGMYGSPDGKGRFPKNVVFSHSLFCTDEECSLDCPVLTLDQQAGIRKSGAMKAGTQTQGKRTVYQEGGYTLESAIQSSSGSAARFFQSFPAEVPFFYAAKAATSEKNAGLAKRIDDALFETYQEGMTSGQTFDKNTSQRIAHINHETGKTTYTDYTPSSNQNTHPCVKSISLLKHFITMITPPGGIVLDCFAGSGSTGVAAIELGFHYLLIEINDTAEEPYASICRSRVEHALRQRVQGWNA